MAVWENDQLVELTVDTSRCCVPEQWKSMDATHGASSVSTTAGMSDVPDSRCTRVSVLGIDFVCDCFLEVL